MIGFTKFVPPWVWMLGASIAATVLVGAFAWTYQKAVTATVAEFKEAVFERTVWMKETNLRFEKDQIKIDGSFKGKMQANDEEWK